MTLMTEHGTDTTTGLSVFYGTPKWRDVRHLLLNPSQLGMPEAAKEVGEKIFMALTSRRDTDEPHEPILIENLNSDTESEQDTIFQNIFEHLPGVSVEMLECGVRITQYSIVVTSSIGRQALKFTRSLVPGHETSESGETTTRSLISFTSDSETPLPRE